MHILILQSRRRPEMLALEQGEYTRALAGTDATASFISTLDPTQAWTEPAQLLTDIDGVILGGSGEFDFDGGRADDDDARRISHEIVARLSDLLSYIHEHHVPLLGICYGHQIVAEHQGVSVRNDPMQKKVGSYLVTLTEAGKNDPFFGTMPESFMAQYGHKDSLTALPQGAELLATGAACKFSALRYGPLAYTVQFHPELTAQDVETKLRLSPGYLPEDADTGELIKPSPEASTLIPRFIELIRSR